MKKYSEEEIRAFGLNHSEQIDDDVYQIGTACLEVMHLLPEGVSLQIGFTALVNSFPVDDVPTA